MLGELHFLQFLFIKRDSMKKKFLLFVLTLITSFIFSQKKTVKLIFAGDIMGHDAQIESAYNLLTNNYDYNPVFTEIDTILQAFDFAIGNLELTFAGKPFKGYPRFSSPDEMADAIQNAGFTHLVTANNHSCDNGKLGIERTLKILRQKKIPHTGTFLNREDRKKRNLMLLEKDSVKIGILNYTYGTNGIAIPKPCIVNLNKKEQIATDIENAKKSNLDFLIIFIHWGYEYKTSESKEQRELAKFIFKSGADLIIGSHPHVIQPVKYVKHSSNDSNLVVYSLGNFVSNQRTQPRCGGLLFELELSKINQEVSITGYHNRLVFVDKYLSGKKWHYKIRDCETEFKNGYKNMSSEYAVKKMNEFIKSSQKTLKIKTKTILKPKFRIPALSEDFKNNYRTGIFTAK